MLKLIKKYPLETMILSFISGMTAQRITNNSINYTHNIILAYIIGVIGGATGLIITLLIVKMFYKISRK